MHNVDISKTYLNTICNVPNCAHWPLMGWRRWQIVLKGWDRDKIIYRDGHVAEQNSYYTVHAIFRSSRLFPFILPISPFPSDVLW